MITKMTVDNVLGNKIVLETYVRKYPMASLFEIPKNSIENKFVNKIDKYDKIVVTMFVTNF